MEEREIMLEQILKVLKDIETNTCDKEFLPNTVLLDKKLDRLIELHLEEIKLLNTLTADRCTCKKHRVKHKKESKQSRKAKKGKKEKEE